MGQQMQVSKGRGSEIKWQSLDPEGNVWFSAVISLFDFSCEKCSDEHIGNKLTQILTEAVRLNSDFLSQWYGMRVVTSCEFNPKWGLGTSSTLIYCIAQWADVDPYELYQRTFGGSGYDIACAEANSPIFYKMGEDAPAISKAHLAESIRQHLYFVYTGKKQSTYDSVKQHRDRLSKVRSKTIDQVTQIGHELAQTKTLKDFDKLIVEHESIMSEILHQPKVKESQFSDYWGEVKSLGAWGGDFLLVTSDQPIDATSAYFKNKGHDVLLPWSEIILSQD